MKNAKLYGLVAVLTAANIGFRVLSAEEEGAEGKPVSHVTAGQRVASEELDRLLAEGESDPGACRMVVAFNPDCPFCRKAARLERLAARAGPWGRTLWITDEERARLPEFVEGLPESSRHAVAPEAFEALDVEAVPALFLFDADGVVRWVGPYGGDETSEELAGWCEGEDPVPPAPAGQGVAAVGR